MNKKNISITFSVFTAAFVVTILIYILTMQNMELYTDIKTTMPEDILIYKRVGKEIIEDLKEIENIKNIGLKSDLKAINIGNNISTFVSFNDEYFAMQYKFLKSGDFPKNSDEIIISEKISKDLGLSIGDKITFEFGERILKNEVVKPDKKYNEKEEFKTTGIERYNIVGIYNTQNTNSIQSVIGFIDEYNEEYYPCIRVNSLSKIYETKAEIDNLINKDSVEKTMIILNERLLKFFYISEDGINLIDFIMAKLLVPFILIMVFIFMIKNIFNVWSIYKIKELSMYKSIGATNFQIYKILLKDSLKISFLPLLLGEISGFVIVNLVFDKIFSLQHELYSIETKGFILNGALVSGITVMLLFIIMVAISFPARTISKIEILEGLKENIALKNYKKKRSRNLFKELRINNRKILKPVFIIMTVGLVMLECSLCISAIDDYNTENSRIDRVFNFKLRYSTKENKYPAIFNEIKEEFNPEESLITIEKRFYVDTSSLKFSKDFNKIGFSEGYRNISYYPELELVDGILIGLEDERFKKISENKDDVVLVNLVQEDPRTFYREANFIPYLDKSVNSLDIKYLKDFGSQKLEINKMINQLIEDQDKLFVYDIELVTSIDNFRKIMKESEKEFSKNGMKLPTIYYNLEMKFEENDLPIIAQKIQNIMEEQIEANEKYYISNTLLEKELQEINKKGMLFLFSVILIAVIILNVGNAYSSTNLSFFNRKREIGALLSCGMCVEDLEKMLKKEIIGSIILSIICSSIVSAGIIGYLISTLPYLNYVKYFNIIRFDIMIPIIVIISLLSYVIYVLAMKKVTDKNIIELIKE